MGYMEQYRALAPWRQAVYLVCVLAAAVLVILDIVDKSVQYTTLGVVVLIAIAIAVRPGGVRGPTRT